MLHRHSLKKIRGVRNRHKGKVASNTWHDFTSLAQAASEQASQVGALSRITVVSLQLENWAIFHKLLIQSTLPSFVHGKALAGKSQHHKPWYSPSSFVPPACPQALFGPSWLRGAHYGDTLKSAGHQLIAARPSSVSAHSIPREYT